MHLKHAEQAYKVFFKALQETDPVLYPSGWEECWLTNKKEQNI